MNLRDLVAEPADSSLADAALTSIERAIASDGCDTAFVEYNVDCHDGYDALQAIYQATGDPRAQDAYAQRVKFYPRGAD